MGGDKKKKMEKDATLIFIVTSCGSKWNKNVLIGSEASPFAFRAVSVRKDISLWLSMAANVASCSIHLSLAILHVMRFDENL